MDKVYNVIPFQQLQYRRVTPTMALRSTKQRAITALIGKKQGWSVQGHWEQRALEAIEIKKNKSSMNLDRGLHLPLVWNPVLGLTWPLIPYFTICSTPRPMSCMFLSSFHLKPLLNYIRPIFSQSHIPQLLLPFFKPELRYLCSIITSQIQVLTSGNPGPNSVHMQSSTYPT